MSFAEMTWEQYKEVLAKAHLPAALVNLDAFFENADHLYRPVRQEGKTVRIASKSLRSPALMRLAFDHAPDLVRGVMAYACKEAEYLSEQGFDDFLVAYPTLQPSDLDCLVRMTRAGKSVALVVDCKEHVDALSAAGRAASVTLRACLDMDASLHPTRPQVHIGVRRSPLRTANEAAELARYAQNLKGIRIAGLMIYEAQIAGLPDANPFSTAANPIRRLVKVFSKPHVATLRKQSVEALTALGLHLDFVNGGGTGSAEWTSSDRSVTEVTIGSGLFCPHLFSYYRNLPLLPAAFFALQVVRSSDRGFITCHGGGYVASGEAGADRLPVPYLPRGLSLLPMEGAGEVQTPLRLCENSPPIRLGDPVVFRHAKAGELSERFNEYLLVREGRLVGTAPTYRGLGRSFL